jgi:hypothetical protein
MGYKQHLQQTRKRKRRRTQRSKRGRHRHSQPNTNDKSTGLEYISDNEHEDCDDDDDCNEYSFDMAAPGTPGCNGADYDDDYNTYHGTTIKDGSSRYGCDGTATTTDNNDDDIGYHSDSNAGSSTGDDNSSHDTTTDNSLCIAKIDDTSDNEKTLRHHDVDVDIEDDDVDVNDDNVPVPFDDILQTALQYMKQYPPSSLIELSRQYYQDQWYNQLLMLDLPPEIISSSSSSSSSSSTNNIIPLIIQQTIGFFGSCPKSSIVPFCESDWIVKQRLRQHMGLKGSSRKDRRRRKQTATTANGTTTNHTSLVSLDPMEYIRNNPNQLAVIAVGYGLGTGPELRAAARRRRRRRIVTGAAVIVGILAMGGSLYYQQLQQQGSLTSSSPRNLWLGRISQTPHYPLSLSSLGGNANSSLDDKVCSASTGSRGDDSTARNAAAINKAAFVILPRITVLQEGTSLPPSATSNQKALQSRANLHTPKSNVILPNTDSTAMLPHGGAFNKKTKPPAGATAIVNNAGRPPSDIMSNQASIIVSYTQKMKRLISKLLIKIFVEPWRQLRGMFRQRK